jgi:hypothetical protein
MRPPSTKKDDLLAAVGRYSRDARLLAGERDNFMLKARLEGATLAELAEAGAMECIDVASILRSPPPDRQL